MSVVPPDRVGKIEFGEAHVAPWTANAVAIGSTAPTVTAWAAKVTAARAAYLAQQEAQDAAKAATNDFNVKLRAMDLATSEIVQQVRTKAASAGAGVYTLAQIPAPATPSPVGPPGTPTGFAVKLFQDGSLALTWKCANPKGSAGTMYQVYRRAGATGEFAYIGGAGEKKFVDATLPAGAAQVTYQIQGVRSTAVGPWAQFNVNFGSAAAGGMSASVGETSKASPKLAA